MKAVVLLRRFFEVLRLLVHPSCLKIVLDRLQHGSAFTVQWDAVHFFRQRNSRGDIAAAWGGSERKESCARIIIANESSDSFDILVQFNIAYEISIFVLGAQSYAI